MPGEGDGVCVHWLEFQLGKMRKCQVWVTVTVVQQRECLFVFWIHFQLITPSEIISVSSVV